MLLFTIQISAQIAIPDVEFENILLSNGIDTGFFDGFISQVDAEAVTGTLNISPIGSFGGEVTNITRIEGFVNITGLDALPGGANIQVMDLPANTELSYLNLTNSIALTSIDLSNNTKLTEVYLSPFSGSSSGGFSGVNLSNLSVLNKLEINGGDFSSIDLSDCVLLDDLRMTQCNNLLGLDLSNMVLLVKFKLVILLHPVNSKSSSKTQSLRSKFTISPCII